MHFAVAQLLNNLPISLKGHLNCICTDISIKANVFIQKNIYHIHTYVHKSIENCLFKDKFPFSSSVLSRILPSFPLIFWKILRLLLLIKDLLIKKCANCSFNANRCNFLVNKIVRFVLGFYV